MNQGNNNINGIDPKVSIVIVNWNTWKDIELCLNSLRQTDYPNYEVVVVDNDSSDGSSKKIAETFPDVVLIASKKNLGWAGGNNAGIRQALEKGAEYIWLLNNDTVVPPETLSALVRSAQSSSEAQLLGPMLYNEHNRSQIQHCGCSFDWKNFDVKFYEDLESIKEVNKMDYWIWGTALFIKRQILEKVGYFSEKYFVYYDDMDFSIRAIKKGFIHTLEPKAKVYHKQHYSGSERVLPLHYYYYITRNQYFFWMAYCPWYKKVSFFRRYVYKNLCSILDHIKKGEKDIIDAYLDGMYSAFVNKGGVWDKDFKMPRIMRKMILSRPNFWCDLFGGRIGGILKSSILRVKRIFTKSKPNEK